MDTLSVIMAMSQMQAMRQASNATANMVSCMAYGEAQELAIKRVGRIQWDAMTLDEQDDLIDRVCSKMAKSHA